MPEKIDETLLNDLRRQVADDRACWALFESDCALEYPDGATLAVKNRMERAWSDPSDLMHSLRGRGMTEAEVAEVIAADQDHIAAVWAEDERREAEARKMMKDAA